MAKKNIWQTLKEISPRVYSLWGFGVFFEIGFCLWNSGKSNLRFAKEKNIHTYFSRGKNWPASHLENIFGTFSASTEVLAVCLSKGWSCKICLGRVDDKFLSYWSFQTKRWVDISLTIFSNLQPQPEKTFLFSKTKYTKKMSLACPQQILHGHALNGQINCR